MMWCEDTFCVCDVKILTLLCGAKIIFVVLVKMILFGAIGHEGIFYVSVV